jgi:hypothetical protein
MSHSRFATCHTEAAMKRQLEAKEALERCLEAGAFLASTQLAGPLPGKRGRGLGKPLRCGKTGIWKNRLLAMFDSVPCPEAAAGNSIHRCMFEAR